MPGPEKPLTLTSSLSMPNTSLRIPIIGFGTWDSPQSKATTSVLHALKTGYRHIDTAQGYHNETQVGEALKQTSIPRTEIFVVTKIWSPRGSLEANYKSCLESVEKIDGGTGPGGKGKGKGYVDLFLIHNVLPTRKDREEVWGALERLYNEGRVKAIGVSNWGVKIFEEAKEYAKVWPPMNNQVELHPWCQQPGLIPYLEKQGIAITAYSPLVRNREKDNPTVVAIAKAHGKTEAQILLRYCLEKGWAPLPKSDTPSRIEENADVFDFELSKEEMEKLDGLRRGKDEPCVMVADN